MPLAAKYGALVLTTSPCLSLESPESLPQRWQSSISKFLEPRCHLLIVINIDRCPLPFASLNTTLEQNVNLTEGSVLHLRNPDPRQDGTNQGGASPDVAALAAQVPLIGVEHVAGKEDARNVDQVVCTSSDTGCQWSETNRRCLTDDNP